MKKLIIALMAAVALFIVGTLLVGQSGRSGRAEQTEVYRDTVVVYDTIRYVEPMAQTVTSVGTQTYIVACSDGGLARAAAADTDSASSGYIKVTAIGTGDGGLARADSAVVEMTVVQRRYADTLYEAWVSGPIDPRLDSINIYSRTTAVSNTIKKQYRPPNRWGVGIAAGAGFTPQGVQPYIGIGLTYSIISF
jgi:hypothetical protein